MLLGRSLRADAKTPLSARVQTVVFVGNRQIQSEAQLWRAPGRLSITYLSGPMRGQGSGFSQHWFWRQEGSGLVPYAEVSQTPEEMARARFALMRQNYRAQLQAPQKLGGRDVEVVELRPLHPAPGARGPARRVFIDTRTGLTLRTESFNYRLQPVSHSTFSRLELQPKVKPTTFEPPAAIAAAAQKSFWQGEELGQNERAVEAKVGLTPPRSERVPDGFTVDGVGVHRCARSVPGLQVAAFTRYSDGINELTLFAVKTLPLSALGALPTGTLPTGALPIGALPTDETGVAEPGAGKPLVAPFGGVELNCNFGPGTVISRVDGAGMLVAMGDLPVAVLQRALGDAQFRAVAVATAMPTAIPTAMPAK